MEVICSGSESLLNFILDWCADCVQYPEEKQGIALVLKSETEGTGKTFFCDRFGELFGPHYIRAAKKDMIVGRFSGHLEDNILLGAEEAVYAGDPTTKNIIKDMITSKTRNIERKSIDAEINKPNFSHIIFISNEDHVVSSSPTDRRFQTIEVSKIRFQQRAYFRQLKKQWTGGERESFLKLLMSRDVKDIDIAKNRIMTAEALHQIELSLPHWEKWIKNFLDDGYVEYSYFDPMSQKIETNIHEFAHENEIASDFLFDNYVEFCKVKKLKYLKAKSELTVLLKKIFNEMEIDRQRLAGVRRTIWVLPTYENMIKAWNDKRIVKIQVARVARGGQGENIDSGHANEP